MMDGENVVSNNQSLVATAGAILSENSYDLGVAGTPPAAFQAVGSIFHDIGRGKPMFCFVKVTETFTSTSSDITCQCALVMADDAALTSSLTVLYETPAIACAVLIAGYQFRMGSIPPGISKRFIGYRYTTAVHDATAGKVFGAFLTEEAFSVRVSTTGL